MPEVAHGGLQVSRRVAPASGPSAAPQARSGAWALLQDLDLEACEREGALPPSLLLRLHAFGLADEELPALLEVAVQKRSLGAALALCTLADARALALAAGLAPLPHALEAAWPACDALSPTRVTPEGDLVLDARLPAVVNARALPALLLRLSGERIASVDLRAQGVTLSESGELGLRAAGLCRVELRGVLVRASDVATIDASLLHTLRARNRRLLSAAVIQACRALIAETFTFVGRRAFQGSVLAAQQVVRHRAADLDASYRALRALHRRAHGASASPARDTLLLLEHMHSTVPELVKHCQQLHGGRGYLADHGAARAFRDVEGLGCLLGERHALRAERQALESLAPPALARADELDPREAFRLRARAIVAAQVAPLCASRELEQPERVRALHRLFAREQLTTVSLPVCEGGLGRDFRYTLALIEELMLGADASAAVSLMLAAGTVFPLIDRHGSPALRAQLLPRIARGEAILAFGITEPDGGSDLAHSTRTRARVEGEELVIDGSKLFLTNAPIADYVLLLARTSERSGPFSASLIVVPMSSPGVTRSAPFEKLGLAGSPTGAIELRDVRVPADHLVGRAGLGLSLLADAAAYERLLIAAGALALGERCLSLAQRARSTAHAPHDPAITQDAALAAQRALLASVVDGLGDAAPRREDAALLKFSACEAAQRAIESAASALRGSDDAEAVASVRRALCDSRIFSVFAGASEMMRDAYAASLMPRIRLGAWGSDG